LGFFRTCAGRSDVFVFPELVEGKGKNREARSRDFSVRKNICDHNLKRKEPPGHRPSGSKSFPFEFSALEQDQVREPLLCADKD
jgi:hypothetical protein